MPGQWADAGKMDADIFITQSELPRPAPNYAESGDPWGILRF